jgi:hypothetical protein
VTHGKLAASVTLDRHEAQSALAELRKFEGPLLRGLHDKIFRAWRLRGAHTTITVPLTQRELEAMRRLGASASPQVVRYKWFAIYVDGTEVFTQTTKKPPKHKTLRVPGKGRKKFKLQRLYKLPLDSKESEQFMARKKAAVKDVEEEIDELEGLEELEDEDLVEEPDVEEDEDEVEEKPKRRKKKAAAAPKKRTKKKAVVEEDDEDEDEEDDEDDEDEEPVVKKRTRTKASTKGKGNAKSKSNGEDKKSAAGRTTKEMTGGVGTSELAEAASEVADIEITGRDVRVYLRKNEVEKNEEHGRYYWKSTTSPQFKKLAKLIAKEYAE